MRTSPNIRLAIKAAIPALVGLFMLWASWLGWPDVIVDFGRELYVPWLISEGGALYADVQYWNGPLSPHINALVFRVFGPSILAIELLNLMFITLSAVLIYLIFDDKDDPVPAPMCASVFLALFAFAQYYWNGNFNFMAPYSHELVHGTFLALLAIYSVKRHAKHKGIAWLAIASFMVGLSVLTKIEIFVSTIAAVWASLALMTMTAKPGERRASTVILVALIGLILPVVVSVALLSISMPIADALKGVFGSWVALATTDVGSGVFQKDVMGTNDVGGNIRKIFASLLWYLPLVIPIAIGFAIRGKEALRRYAILIGFVISAILHVAFYNVIPWFDMFRALQVFVATAIVVALFLAFKARGDEVRASRVVALFAFSIFSLGMLLKMLLNVHVFHYGFSLAMPATVLFAFALSSSAPAALQRLTKDAGVFRGWIIAGLAVMVVWHMHGSWKVYSMKNFMVGEGSDRIAGFDPRIRPEALGVKLVLDELKKTLGPDDDFVVMPEGATLNFMLKRPNPAGYLNFVPSELTIFGEEAMVRAFSKKPPAYIVLFHKDTSDYGYRFFGRDYGVELYGWILGNYEPFHLIGEEPLKTDAFGVLILKRRS